MMVRDIHMGNLAIAWARKSFPKITVVYVADHHKNYDHCWFELIEELRTEARIYGVHFLKDDAVTIDGVASWAPRLGLPSNSTPHRAGHPKAASPHLNRTWI